MNIIRQIWIRHTLLLWFVFVVVVYGVYVRIHFGNKLGISLTVSTTTYFHHSAFDLRTVRCMWRPCPISVLIEIHICQFPLLIIRLVIPHRLHRLQQYRKSKTNLHLRLHQCQIPSAVAASLHRHPNAHRTTCCSLRSASTNWTRAAIRHRPV